LIDAVLERADALRSYGDVADGHVAIVAAPEGYGKSVMLRTLAGGNLSIVDVRAGSTFERFVGDLTRSLEPYANGIARSLATAYGPTLELTDGPDVLAAWFARFLGGLTHALAIDGIDAVEDVRILDFVRGAIQRTSVGVRWTLVGRDVARLRSLVPAGTLATELGEPDLRLAFPELKRLAFRLAPSHSSADLFAIARLAAGSISRAVFLLRCMHFGIADLSDGASSFETLLDRCFANLSERERLETMAGILLEEGGGVEEGALAREISSVASRLRTTAPFLFEAGGERLQASFRGRLGLEIRALIATNRTDLFIRAADALEANGDTASAIALYCAVDAVDRLLTLVERRGRLDLEGEQMHVLREAIALIPEDVREGHALVVGLRAVDAANRGRSAEAVGLFERALSLSTPGDRDQSIRYWYASRAVGTGDSALVRRLIVPSVELFRTRPTVRAAMLSLLGVACAMDGDFPRARNWIARARTISDACGDSALSARVHQQAAYVALRAGDLDDANALGLQAVAFAEACAWPHVAAITYSILHHVAAERGQYERMGAYARRLAENASRSGNVALHYLAVSAIYEYETEHCNLPRIAEARAELAQFDLETSPALFGGGLASRPAAAMEIAWEGHFGHAFAHLEPLLLAFERSPRDPSCGEAHTFATAAIYAAAAGMVPEADRALRAFRSRLAAEDRYAYVQRARIEEALALRLLSRDREASLVLRTVARGLPASRSRLHAYAELVGSVVETTESALGAHRPGLEDEMHANGWGGLARVVRSIVAGSRAGRESFGRRNRAIG
jgi:tetratricopeptide (TPR) repeat protein